VMTLHPRFGRNVHNALACAPFAEDGAVVKHIRARIAARAELLGYRAAEAGWTIEANGAPLARDEAGDWVVPAGAAGVTLRACTWRPADLEPGNTDTRRLGLCLAGLALDGAPVALDDARLVSGFHAMETSGAAQWRWTDGAAMIALAGERRLRLDLLRTPLEWRRAA